MTFEEFKYKHQKVQVEEYPNTVNANNIVSVCIMTYQHINFIRTCLDSILAQKTFFSFEILLGEDMSSDGTREICIEYALKYPEKIRLFLHSRENNIKINGQPTGRFNFLYNLYNAKSKYIAICEGDDSWTDPLKLQKQVDFLDENEGYNLAVGGFISKNALTKNEEKVIKRVKSNDFEFGYTFSLKDIQSVWITKTLTAVFRNDQQIINSFAAYKYGRDINLFYHILKNSKGIYFTEIFGLYNIHEAGINSLKGTSINYKAAYEVYKELHIANNDEFTRVRRFKQTLNLMNIYLYNGENQKGFSKIIFLLSEAFKLVKYPKDIKWIIAALIKK